MIGANMLASRMENINPPLNIEKFLINISKYTPLPELSGRNGRELILVEPHQIKAILIEE